MRSHITGCAKYAVKYKAGEEMKTPEQEFLQHKDWLGSAEHAVAKEQAKEALYDSYKDMGDKRNAKGKMRYGSHLSSREIALQERGEIPSPNELLGATVDDTPPISLVGEKLVDGVPVSKILAEPASFTKMQVLRAQVATR